jgi:hypothetical protein
MTTPAIAFNRPALYPLRPAQPQQSGRRLPDGRLASLNLSGNGIIGIDLLRGLGPFTWGSFGANPVGLINFVSKWAQGRLSRSDTVEFKVQIEAGVDPTKIPILGSILSQLGGDPHKWVGGVVGSVFIRGNGSGGVEIEGYNLEVYGLIPGTGGWRFAARTPRGDGAISGHAWVWNGKRDANDNLVHRNWYSPWNGQIEVFKGGQPVDLGFVSGWVGVYRRDNWGNLYNTLHYGGRTGRRIGQIAGAVEVANNVVGAALGQRATDAQGNPHTATYQGSIKIRIGGPPGLLVSGDLIIQTIKDGRPEINIKTADGKRVLASVSTQTLVDGLNRLEQLVRDSPIGGLLPAPGSKNGASPPVVSRPPTGTPLSRPPSAPIIAPATVNANGLVLGVKKGNRELTALAYGLVNINQWLLYGTGEGGRTLTGSQLMEALKDLPVGAKRTLTIGSDQGPLTFTLQKTKGRTLAVTFGSQTYHVDLVSGGRWLSQPRQNLRKSRATLIRLSC